MNCSPPVFPPDLWKNLRDPANNCQIKPNLGLLDIVHFIANLIQIFISLAGAVAVIMIVVGGIQYMTSAGNPQAVGRAKNTILYSVVGLLLIIFSYAIVGAIGNAF